MPLALNETRSAELVGVSRQTLADWRRQGLIAARKIGEGRNASVMYAVADLYRLVGLSPDGRPLDGDGP